jgi:hypothetical protein
MTNAMAGRSNFTSETHAGSRFPLKWRHRAIGGGTQKLQRETGA